MAGIDFTEDAVFRALGSSQSSSCPRCKGEHDDPTLCPPGPSIAARASALERLSRALTDGVQSKGSGFLAPVTFGYRTGPEKDPHRQLVTLPQAKLPHVGCEWLQRSLRQYGAKAATSRTTQQLVPIFPFAIPLPCLLQTAVC